MSSIITNPRIAGKNSMSKLEAKARAGDPLAQDQLEKQAFRAAELTKKLQRQSMTRVEAQRELTNRK